MRLRLTPTFLVVLALAPPSTAQAPVARLRAVEEMRIDGAEHGFVALRHALQLRDGGVAITDIDDPRIRYFSGTGRPEGAFGGKGSGPGEFLQVVHAGLVGDTVWAADLSLSRVTSVGPRRELIRTVKLLRRVVAPGTASDRGGPEPMFLLLAMVDGRALGIAIPQTASWPPWLPRHGDGSPVVLVDPAGRLDRYLGWRSGSPGCSEPWEAGAMRGTVPVPFCASGLFAISQTGEWLAFIEQRNASGPKATFDLTLVRSSGDSAFTKRMDYLPVAVRSGATDSALKGLREFSGGLSAGGLPPEALAAIDRMEIPTTHPPVHAVVAGLDGAVWLGLERGEPGYTWLGLLPNGTALGELQLPRNVRVVNATATMLWAVETDDDGVPSVVRYRVVR